MAHFYQSHSFTPRSDSEIYTAWKKKKLNSPKIFNPEIKINLLQTAGISVQANCMQSVLWAICSKLENLRPPNLKCAACPHPQIFFIHDRHLPNFSVKPPSPPPPPPHPFNLPAVLLEIGWSDEAQFPPSPIPFLHPRTAPESAGPAKESHCSFVSSHDPPN